MQAIKQQRAQAQAAQQQAAQAQQAQQTLAQNYNKLNEAHRPGSPAEAIFKQGGGQ